MSVSPDTLILKAFAIFASVKNSCYYQDDFAGGDILENANLYLDEIIEILSDIKCKNLNVNLT